MSKCLAMKIMFCFCLFTFVLSACHIETENNVGEKSEAQRTSDINEFNEEFIPIIETLTDSTEELIIDTDNEDEKYSVLEDIEFDSTKGISYREVIEICKKYIGEYMDVEGYDGYPYGFRCHEGTIVYENNEYFIVRVVTVGDFFVSYAGHAFVSIDGDEIYDGIKHSDGTYSFGRILNADPDIYTEFS